MASTKTPHRIDRSDESRGRGSRSRRIAAVVVGVVVLILLVVSAVSVFGSGGDGDTSVAQPSASASASPEVTSSGAFKPAFTFALPDSWKAQGDDLRYLGLQPIGTPDSERTGIFVLSNVVAVKQNCSARPDPGVGTSSAAITDWMSNYGALDGTSTEPVRIGGVPGHSVEIGLASSEKPCPGFDDIPLLVGEPSGTPSWGIEPGTRMRVYVLDLAGGTTATIMIEVQDPAQFQAMKDEAIPIVESLLWRSFRSASKPATPVPPAALGALAYPFQHDFYIADWNGANPRRIADGSSGTKDCPDDYWAEGTIWSPNGRYLAFRHSTCRNGEISHDVVISDPEGNLVASIPSDGWNINWSPDSTRVAVWVTLGKTIGVYGLDGDRQELLSLPRGLMTTGDNDPMWSRDGDSLLVPNGVEIPLDGTTPRQLPKGDPRSLDAVYSPDGSRIAYRDDSGSLFVAAADGSDAREAVSSGGWVEEPFWSPTGDRIAFAYSDGASDSSTEIRVLDLSTGNVTSLIGKGGSDHLSAIEFSPKGDRILFQRIAKGASDGMSSLWSIDADGSDASRLVTGAWIWGDWRSVSGAS